MTPDLAAQFAALKQRFLDGLPARLEEIEHASDAPAAHAALHRLVGAAGTYGEDMLAQCARAAMQAHGITGNLREREATLQALRAELLRLRG